MIDRTEGKLRQIYIQMVLNLKNHNISFLDSGFDSRKFSYLSFFLTEKQHLLLISFYKVLDHYSNYACF